MKAWDNVAPRRSRYHPDAWPWWLQMALCGALGGLIAVAGLW